MKPALTFTPVMFKSAIDRRKDVTRRVATTGNQNQIDQLAAAIEKDLHRDDGLMTEERAMWNTFPPPYGPPGTILPMVTSWAAHRSADSLKPTALFTDHSRLWFDDGTAKPEWAGKSRPARFLPKSLYHLAPQVQIVSTRAEPLHAITEDDALREGIAQITKDAPERGDATVWKYGLADRDGLPGTDDFGWPWNEWQRTACEAYFKLWDSINAERAEGQYAAAHNPIVWRIEFKLL